MSFAVDALVGFDVIESDDDWTPVSFALVLALPVGFALLALAGRFAVRNAPRWASPPAACARPC
jgi:hypothetical protein